MLTHFFGVHNYTNFVHTYIHTYIHAFEYCMSTTNFNLNQRCPKKIIEEADEQSSPPLDPPNMAN